MAFPDLAAGDSEVGRTWTPMDESKLPEPEPWAGATLLIRRGMRAVDGSRFVRVDYDPTRAGWPTTGPIRLHLTARQVDPITKAPRSVLVDGSFELAPQAGGGFAAELRTPPDGNGAAVGDTAASHVWVNALFSDPLHGRCAPVRLELRFSRDGGGASDPPGDAAPYQVVLNTAQLRNRSNVRQHRAPMGSGEQVVSLFYTNPDAQGLGVMKRIQPPYTPAYHELTSDMRLFWEYRIPAGGKINVHRHNTEEIWHVTAGEGTFIQDGEEQVIRAGDSIIIYPGSWHGMRADRGDFAFLVIDIGAARSNQPH